MENKLTLKFDNLNDIIKFYKLEIKKSNKRTLATVVNIGVNGCIVTNPDGNVYITWNFKTTSKRNKFIKAYSHFRLLHT